MARIAFSHLKEMNLKDLRDLEEVTLIDHMLPRGKKTKGTVAVLLPLKEFNRMVSEVSELKRRVARGTPTE